METLFDLGTQFVNAALAQTNGREVAYERYCDGEYTTLSCVAVISQSTIQMVTADDVAMEYEVFDFIMDSAELLVGGVFQEPQSGDRIRTEDGQLYEVLRDVGVPCWRWSDSYGKRVRIHTKPQGLVGVP